MVIQFVYLATLFILFQATKQLVVSNVSTMKMNDDALVVAISPDAKYIAVALLDSTVKVRCLNLSCSVYNMWFPKTQN